MNHPSQTSLGRFMLLNVQDLFGRDGSSTGPWGKYQNIDESSALKNLDRPVQALGCDGYFGSRTNKSVVTDL